MPHHLAQIVLHLLTPAATEVNTTENINQHYQHVIMIVIKDDVVHASEATGNSVGDASSHSLDPGDRTSIQIKMEPDATKPDLTSYEVIKPENP